MYYQLITLFLFWPSALCYGKIGVLDNVFLEELFGRYGSSVKDPMENEFEQFRRSSQNLELDDKVPVHSNKFQTRMDDLLLDREPSIRDQEYLEHSSLWGSQYMQGGAGEGKQHLKPDGSVKNIQVVKTDSVLPAYCNPPNPCPLGYTGEDDCLEDFENTAAFSREYQSSQKCMCDNEHMFDCLEGNQENQLDTIARSIQNSALDENDLDKILSQSVDYSGKHRVVAKKFHTKKVKSPTFYLKGEKLPIVAKKSPNI